MNAELFIIKSTLQRKNIWQKNKACRSFITSKWKDIFRGISFFFLVFVYVHLHWYFWAFSRRCTQQKQHKNRYAHQKWRIYSQWSICQPFYSFLVSLLCLRKSVKYGLSTVFPRHKFQSRSKNDIEITDALFLFLYASTFFSFQIK